MRRFPAMMCLALLLGGTLSARERISSEQRALLIREMMAEHAVASMLIPRSKKALGLTPKGKVADDEQWEEATSKFGPAARLGDMVEITKVEFKGKRVVFELNHGIKGGRRWWHRIQVSGTASATTLGANEQVYAPGGTKIALVFEDGIPPLTSEEVKKMLAPILDFTERSATELYIERLPQEFQDAIKEKRVLVDMDRDMVLLAKGRPDRKYRDFKDGVETEDWIYGTPPGDVTFVTFEDGKVVRINESYATVGGEVKVPETEPQR